MSVPLRPGALMLAVTAITGCGVLGGSAPDPFEGTAPESQGIVIRVDNQRLGEVRIFSEGPDGQRLLGSVRGGSKREFRKDWTRRASIRVRIALGARGPGRYLTNAVVVGPGGRLELIIPQDTRNAILRRR